MKSILGRIGSLLLTLGTLCVYAGYAASQQKFLLVSDMLQHWPLAGSLTFGLGNSLLGISLLSRDNAYTIATCMASAWAVVGSSEDYGQQWIRVVHCLSVALFMWTSYLVFLRASDSGSSNAKGGLVAGIVFFSCLAVLSGLMMAVSYDSEDMYWAWRQTISAAEVALLMTYFVGYVDVFFISNSHE